MYPYIHVHTHKYFVNMSGMMYPGSVDYVRRCGENEKEYKNTNKTGQLGQKGILISVFRCLPVDTVGTRREPFFHLVASRCCNSVYCTPLSTLSILSTFNSIFNLQSSMTCPFTVYCAHAKKYIYIVGPTW